ncbi:MAG: PUA domain-containing protein [Nitrosopumilaceae archaeon]
MSKSETAAMLKAMSSQWKIELPKIKNLKVYEITDKDTIITGNSLVAIKAGETYLPLLSEISLLEKFPRVVVDMGAVKFVCNGANVMRPGITRFSEFEKSQIVCVVEESQNKYLATGKSLLSSTDAEASTKGEVVKTMHYISDKFWEARKEIKE